MRQSSAFFLLSLFISLQGLSADLSINLETWTPALSGEFSDGTTDVSTTDIGVLTEQKPGISIALEHDWLILPNLSYNYRSLVVEGLAPVTTPFTFAGRTLPAAFEVKSEIDLTHNEFSLYWDVIEGWASLQAGVSLHHYDSFAQLVQGTAVEIPDDDTGDSTEGEDDADIDDGDDAGGAGDDAGDAGDADTGDDAGDGGEEDTAAPDGETDDTEGEGIDANPTPGKASTSGKIRLATFRGRLDAPHSGWHLSGNAGVAFGGSHSGQDLELKLGYEIAEQPNRKDATFGFELGYRIMKISLDNEGNNTLQTRLTLSGPFVSLYVIF